MTKRPTQRENRAALDWLGVTAGKMTGEEFAEKYGERAKRRDLEGPIHRACWQWAKVATWWWPWLYHVPNSADMHGGDLIRIQRADMGVTPGWNDFHLDLSNGHHPYARIEVKSEHGRLTKWQVLRQDMACEQGAFVAVVRSLDDFIQASRTYFDHMPSALRDSRMAESKRYIERMADFDDWA